MAAKPQIASPTAIPSTVRMAARRPDPSPTLSMKAKFGPGLISAVAKAAQNAKKIQPAPKPLPIPRPNPAGGKIRAKYRNQHPEGKAGDLF